MISEEPENKIMKTNLLIVATIVLMLIAASGFAQVTDIDGKTYKTVIIGGQTWMTENLNVSKFRNGDPIPQAKTKKEWKKAGENKQPAWCFYDNDSTNCEKFGKLYNWYAVTDPRSLSPAGWHVPSDAEWSTLIDCLGGDSIAATKMKDANVWKDNSKETNKSGFSASPGGFSYSNGQFFKIEQTCYFWSNTMNQATRDGFAWFRLLSNLSQKVTRSYLNSSLGFSLRCIRD